MNQFAFIQLQKFKGFKASRVFDQNGSNYQKTKEKTIFSREESVARLSQAHYVVEGQTW
jgi:hypothetical protein